MNVKQDIRALSKEELRDFFVSYRTLITLIVMIVADSMLYLANLAQPLRPLRLFNISL